VDDLNPVTDRMRVSLGAYVLGALDPAERAELEAHLGGCAGCRQELATLAGMPGLLGRVDAGEAEQAYEPAPERLLERTLGELVRRRRRDRRRRSVAAAAAAVVLVASGAGGALALTGRATSGPAGSQTVSAADSSSGVRASVQLRARPWGTQLSVDISGVPAGTRCRLVALGAGGRQEMAGTWQVSYTGRAAVDGATAIPRNELTAVQVLDQHDRPVAVLTIR